MKASLTTPENGGRVRMEIAITQKTPENGSRTLSQERLSGDGGEGEVWLPTAPINFTTRRCRAVDETAFPGCTPEWPSQFIVVPPLHLRANLCVGA